MYPQRLTTGFAVAVEPHGIARVLIKVADVTELAAPGASLLLVRLAGIVVVHDAEVLLALSPSILVGIFDALLDKDAVRIYSGYVGSSLSGQICVVDLIHFPWF